MEYTFGQAKTILQGAAYLHGTDNVGTKINNAVAALAGLNGWDFMRKLVRSISASPVFSLPQGTAGLVRVCLNGRPASLHGTDYQFLHSGPGKLDDYLMHGFSPIEGGDVADVGYSPVMYPLPEPSFICAVSPYVTVPKPGGSTRPQDPITVTGKNTNGEKVRITVPVQQGSINENPTYQMFGTDVFQSIDSVVLDADDNEYITLYGMTTHGSVFMLGHYHPDVKVPKFHMYRIASNRPGPFDILAEVRIEPLPMIDDTDVLPVPSLEPIKHMMLYDANMAMNELQTAQQYMQQALQWLQQMQQADRTIQTPVVDNVLFDGSSGETTDIYENL